MPAEEKILLDKQSFASRMNDAGSGVVKQKVLVRRA